MNLVLLHHKLIKSWKNRPKMIKTGNCLSFIDFSFFQSFLIEKKNIKDKEEMEKSRILLRQRSNSSEQSQSTLRSIKFLTIAPKTFRMTQDAHVGRQNWPFAKFLILCINMSTQNDPTVNWLNLHPFDHHFTANFLFDFSNFFLFLIISRVFFNLLEIERKEKM